MTTFSLLGQDSPLNIPLKTGNDLKMARQLLGLSQKELAIQIGKSAVKVSHAEAAGDVPLDRYIALATRSLLTDRMSAIAEQELKKMSLSDEEMAKFGPIAVSILSKSVQF